MIKAKPLFLLSRRSTPYWDADDKALNWGKRREEPLIARTTPGWACPQGRGDLPNSCLKLIQPFMGITCNSCGSGQAQEMSSPSYFTPFSAQYFLWYCSPWRLFCSGYAVYKDHGGFSKCSVCACTFFSSEHRLQHGLELAGFWFCIHNTTSDCQISTPFWITSKAMALLSYNAAYREKKSIFFLSTSFPTSLTKFLFQNSNLWIWEHMSEHFYILATPFPSSASQLNLQNQPPPRQSSKITYAVRARMEKCASKQNLLMSGWPQIQPETFSSLVKSCIQKEPVRL